MKNGFNKFGNVVNLIARWLNWVAGASLVLMVGLVIIDVLGTKIIKTPLPGGIELVSLLCVIAIALAIAQTQILHGHIEVEMLVEKFPKNVRQVIAGIVHLLGIVLFSILSWKSFGYGKDLHSSGEVSMTLQLPYYPFVYAIGISSIIVVLVLIVQFIKVIKES